METKAYFIHLLSSYINNRNPMVLSNAVNWNEILELSNTHAIQGMIFMAIDKLEKKPPIYDDLKKAFIMSVNIATQQEVWMEKVIDVLNKNNIDHVLIKGYVLRNYYPNKELRTFGDVDFLIDKFDRLVTDKSIKSIGFEYDQEAYSKDVWTYHKGCLNLEVHTDMIYEELFNNFDYISYFREKLENKQLISGHTYELKKEDHLIYILVHLAKHFYHAGVGIRMIADVAVFINKFAEILDFEYIDDEMKRLELSEFANVIYFIVNKYFGTDVDCKDISLNSEKRILEYVLNHGVFGFDNKDVDSIMWHSGKEDTFNVLIRKLFPDYRTMVTYFDWFENKPKIMLPYAWLRRWIEYILNPQKRSVIKYKVDTALSKSDDVNIHQDMLEIVGLKK